MEQPRRNGTMRGLRLSGDVIIVLPMTKNSSPGPDWSMVIAFYNEAGFLPATLASLAAQTLRPLQLILVDNGSTDGSLALAEQFAASHTDIDVRLVCEPTPGQVHALAAGLRIVTSAFVAIGDADTLYPPDYLASADAIFAADRRVVAIFAHDSAGAPDSWRERLARRLRDALLIGLARGQTYAGGYAHLFRSDALRAAGGYAPDHWPYVLKDHELVNRVARQGRFGRAPHLWCQPSDRRADRSGVRWTLGERLLYHATPFAAKDWFFYRFLAPRLAARGLQDTVLRQRRWASAPVPGSGS
jgi:glycosyltransferase involved in cell wall biosynthesis